TSRVTTSGRRRAICRCSHLSASTLTEATRTSGLRDAHAPRPHRARASDGRCSPRDHRVAGALMFGDGHCAIPDCIVFAGEGRLMCRRHWWLVPRPLRDPVWRAYRAWTHGRGNLETLRAAQQEAVDAVVARSTS